MKKLVTLSLVLGAASLATGCIFVSDNGYSPPPRCSDGYDNDGDGLVDYPADPGCSSANDDSELDSGAAGGTFTVSWQPQDWNENAGAPTNVGCPSGADTAVVYSLPSTSNDPSKAFRDLFTCSKRSGETDGLPPGAYSVWIEFTNHDGTSVYARSFSQDATVAASGTEAHHFDVQVNRGYLFATWTLMNKGGAPTTCAAAGAGGVEFESMIGNNTPISDQFKCTDAKGTTNPLPIADYLFGLQVIDSSPTPKALGPETTPKPVSIQVGNDLIDTGAFVLQVGF
jgi:hypothetical protein